MQVLEIRKGDTLPLLEGTLRYKEGGIVDLTGATVTFSMSEYLAGDLADTPKIDDVACTITDAAGGQVKYTWTALDTDTVGEYRGEFLVTFPDLSTQHSNVFGIVVREWLE